VNLPYGTEIEERGGWLFHGDKRLCTATSENAHQYFARNDDGEGALRGTLTQAIQKELRLREGETPTRRSERWEKVWSDPVCQQYRRPEHADYWLWNHAFFNAPIEDLQHIAALVGARKGA
jgi:hypothetical protein